MSLRLKDWMNQVEQKMLAETQVKAPVPVIQGGKASQATVTSTSTNAVDTNLLQAAAELIKQGKGQIQLAPANQQQTSQQNTQQTTQQPTSTTTQIQPVAEEEINEVAPPGMEDVVLALKKKFPGHPEKAFAIAWSQYNKKHGKKEESISESNISQGTVIMESKIEEVLSSYPHEHKACQEGWGMDQNFYEALCDHYHREGRIPRSVWHGPLEQLREYVEECYMQDTSMKSDEVEEGILGTIGGGLAGMALGGPVGAAIGAVAGQEATSGGSSLIEDDMEEGLTGAMAGRMAGTALAPEIAPISGAAGAMLGSSIEDAIVDESDDYEDEDDYESEGFFVVIGDEEAGEPFIGMMTKEDGRWRERSISGPRPSGWGSKNYMSYLLPKDIMHWLEQDYGRHNSYVVGPFEDEESAREHAENYFMESWTEESAMSELEESATSTSNTKETKMNESKLDEKYMGFKKTVAAIKKGGSAENPEAVAAAIGRKKYGKEKFQKAAAAGKKLGEETTFEEVTTEGKKETKTGVIHKGTYGSAVDVNSDIKNKKSEVKRGRGRPKKNSDSETGEEKKWDTSALTSMFGGKAPKNSKKGKVIKGKAQSHEKNNEKDDVVESWKKQLNSLLNEGMTITTSMGNEGASDSVSVSATDTDAADLMKILQSSGLLQNRGTSSAMSTEPSDAEAITVEPASADEVMGTLKPEEDSMDSLDFIKKMLGNRASVSDNDSYEACADEEVEEGNAFSGAVAKAKADGIQPGEKITVGGKEYPVKEDAEEESEEEIEESVNPEDFTDEDDKVEESKCNECGMFESKCGCVKSESRIFSDLLKMLESQMSQSEKAQLKIKTPAYLRKEKDKWGHDWKATPHDVEDAEARDIVAKNRLEKKRNQGVAEESLNEWANSVNDSDQKFIADIAFMTNMISGGLNKQKRDQTVLPSTAVKAEPVSGALTMAETLKKLKDIK